MPVFILRLPKDAWLLAHIAFSNLIGVAHSPRNWHFVASAVDQVEPNMQPDDLIDMFSAFGPVTIRRMFGGHGIYHQGRIFALHAFDEVWLKADAQSAPEFIAAGSRQWIYEGKKKPAAMPYWSIPDEALDDRQELVIWARKADAAARRAEQSKKIKPSRPPS